MAGAIAGAVACSGTSSQELSRKVNEYCQRLPTGYSWLIRHVEQENYAAVYESWTGRETGGDLHTYFTFCAHVRQDPAAVEIHHRYVESVASPISLLLVKAVATPESFTAEERNKLVQKLRLGEALATELVAMPLE
jgi:hypothetical protein